MMRDPIEVVTDVAVHQRLAALIRPLCRGDHLNVAHLAETLLNRAFLQEWQVYDRARDTEILDLLDQALRDAQWLLNHRLTQAAEDHLRARLQFGPYFDAVSSGDLTDESALGRQALEFINKDGSSAVHAISILEEQIPEIRGAIAACRAEVQGSSKGRQSAGKMNLRGIQLVYATRFVWKIATGKEAPKRDLNAATTFGRFLVDVFAACQVPGDPRSAFKAWAKESRG